MTNCPRRLPPQEAGDTWARVLVRVTELLESIRLVREASRRPSRGPDLCGDQGGDTAGKSRGVGGRGAAGRGRPLCADGRG